MQLLSTLRRTHEEQGYGMSKSLYADIGQAYRVGIAFNFTLATANISLASICLSEILY